MTTLATPNGFSLDTSGKRMVVDPVTRIEGHLRSGLAGTRGTRPSALAGSGPA